MLEKLFSFRLSVVKSMQLFQVMRQGAVILVSILLAKSMLSQGEIGQFEMLLFIGFSLSFFWVNSILQALLPLYPGLPETDQQALLFNVYLLMLGLSLLLFALMQIGNNHLTQLMVGTSDLPYFYLFSWYLFFNIPSYLLEYFYLLKKKGSWIVAFGLFSFSMHIVVVLLPVFLGYGLLYSFYGLIILAVLKHLWTVLFLVFNARFSYRPDLLKSHLVLLFPLLLFTLLSGLTTIFDNWLVGWFYEDEAMFAIFRFGAKELPLVTAMAGAFSAALIPDIAADLPTALQILKKKSVKLFHLLFPLSALLVLTSSLWFPQLFNADFAPSAAIFNVYLLVLISRMIFTHTILIGLKRTDIVLYISVIEVSVNILLSFWWVHLWGMVGIAMATVVAFTLEKILTMLYLYFWRNISPGQYLQWNWFLPYSFLLILCFLLA